MLWIATLPICIEQKTACVSGLRKIFLTRKNIPHASSAHSLVLEFNLIPCRACNGGVTLGATGSLGATAGASFYWFEATARMRTVLYLRVARNVADGQRLAARHNERYSNCLQHAAASWQRRNSAGFDLYPSKI